MSVNLPKDETLSRAIELIHADGGWKPVLALMLVDRLLKAGGFGIVIWCTSRFLGQ